MSIRLAVRGILMREDRLLMVNAWPGGKSNLLCAPGGGADVHASLEDNLKREIHEETGLNVSVGAVVLVNEFHDPDRPFHQVDIYFRCSYLSGDPDGAWTDPEGVVTERHWLTRAELMQRRFKPDSLPDVAWGNAASAFYDPLEPLLR
ncbi:MAG: NUDIX hydrolase [Pseudomonadota bacterium]